MSKRKYEWEYGENNYQIYLDTYVGKDHLRVFANKAYPDTWMGMYETDKCFVVIMDKTFATRQRKKSSATTRILLSNNPVLSSNNPEYIKKKLIWAYEHGLREITR